MKFSALHRLVIGASALLLAMVPGATTAVNAAPAPAEAARADGSTPDPIAHDPTVIKAGDWYYMIITGAIETRTYLPMSRSKDLVHWEPLGPVFDTAPAWVTEELGFTPGDFWAPDITYYRGRYRLYYAASEFGTNNSVIGLATTKTLDPDHPDFGWVDRGMVFRTTPGVEDYNAIDADIVIDAEDRMWMSFGSFWSGIKLRRINPVTGKLADRSPVHSIAFRPPDPHALEGPSIIRRHGFYYLFVSFDFCCRGVNSDYRVMVGRSRDIRGPYVDAEGQSMLEGGGTELLRGYNEFAGPGHGDVFTAGRADWFAHHYYDRDDEGAPKLSVRRIRWRDGWPTLGDPLTGSREPGRGTAYFKVVNRGSGAVLANEACGFEGANIRLEAYTGSTCEQWRPEYRGDGYYSILNRYSNKVAEAAACGTESGTNVSQWGWLNNACQRFRFRPAGDGFVSIANEASGLVMEAVDCGGPGTNVQLSERTGSQCQQFRLQPVGEVLLVNARTDRGIRVGGCAQADGGLRRGCLWVFRHTDRGYMTVTSRRTDERLVLRTTRDGRKVLGLRDARNAVRRIEQWRLVPTDDGTFMLGNLTGGRREVKVVLPRSS